MFLPPVFAHSHGRLADAFRQQSPLNGVVRLKTARAQLAYWEYAPRTLGRLYQLAPVARRALVRFTQATLAQEDTQMATILDQLWHAKGLVPWALVRDLLP